MNKLNETKKRRMSVKTASCITKSIQAVLSLFPDCSISWEKWELVIEVLGITGYDREKGGLL